jgi:hypothetical protein
MRMRRNRVLLLVSVLLVPLLLVPLLLPACLAAGETESPLGPPPGGYRITAGDSAVVIPFTLFRGDILMSASVNGRQVRMMLDNGFLWDEILFFGSPLVDSLRLAYDGEADLGGSGEGNRVQARVASGITIAFPGVEFTGQTAIVTPYESGLTNMWWGTEGQVSATFLKHFVVAIDYDRMEITLIPPDRFVYEGKGIELPMKALLPGAWGIPAVLEFTGGRRVALDLMMDLGYGDALEVVEGGPNDLRAPDKAIEGSLGFGAQGETRGHFGRLAAIEIGRYTVKGPIAGFVAAEDSASTSHEAMVGMEVFSRFNLVLDYPHQRLYLEPSRRFADPCEYNMSGVEMTKAGGDTLTIKTIHPGSPASRAGLRVGDKVLTINEKPAAGYDIWELRPLFTRQGETVRLVVVREGREKRVPLRLRRLI